MQNPVREDVREILAVVLNVEIENVNDESSTDSLSEWDSLRHMNLIAAVEDNYDIYFKEDEILSATKFLQLVDLIESKLEGKSSE